MIIRTFATNDGDNFRPASRLQGLFDPLERYAVVESAHLDVLVLLHDASCDLQGRRRFDGRGVADDDGSPAPDIVVVGVIGGVNSTRVTWSVRVVRMRCNSEEPVACTFCTWLLGES